MNSARQRPEACRKRRSMVSCVQTGVETGGRRGGGRESWVKTGDIVACRAAVCGSGNIHGDGGMATVVWIQVHPPPQQVPLQLRWQSQPPGWLPDECMPCAICMQWCSEGPADNVIRASAPRSGATASARAKRKSNNRWKVPAMKKRVALMSWNNQADAVIEYRYRAVCEAFTRNHTTVLRSLCLCGENGAYRPMPGMRLCGEAG